MVDYIKEGTVDRPSITLKSRTGICEFKGRSIPKDAGEVYKPVFDWFNTYFENAQEKTILNFKLEFINSGSSKLIFDILTKFKTLIDNGKELIINWYYCNNDEDIRDAGFRFSNLLDHNINIIKE